MGINQNQQRSHGCVQCYEINKGYHWLKRTNTKQCAECGGKVLYIQELLDHVAELHSEIRAYKEIYGEVS